MVKVNTATAVNSAELIHGPDAGLSGHSFLFPDGLVGMRGRYGYSLFMVRSIQRSVFHEKTFFFFYLIVLSTVPAFLSTFVKIFT